MGRPETISCKRCNAVVAVKARGPVPSFCADCRKTSNRQAKTRPTEITCELCGAQVSVKARGPLPRRCRGGCVSTTSGSPKSGKKTLAEASTAVSRPWDRTRPSTTRPAAATATVVSPALGPGVITGATVTRIDTHPITVVNKQDLDRRVRAQQFRHAAAIALWLAVIVVIALVVFIGSQPTAPDF